VPLLEHGGHYIGGRYNAYELSFSLKSEKRSKKEHKVPIFDWEERLKDIECQCTSVDLQRVTLKYEVINAYLRQTYSCNSCFGRETAMLPKISPTSAKLSL
jgi:hypothetical protein